jgi:hypothetical protein
MFLNVGSPASNNMAFSKTKARGFLRALPPRTCLSYLSSMSASMLMIDKFSSNCFRFPEKFGSQQQTGVSELGRTTLQMMSKFTVQLLHSDSLP